MTTARGSNLLYAIHQAERYWTGTGGADMASRLNQAVIAMGHGSDYPLADLGPSDGTTCLTQLKALGYSPAGIAMRYAALRRALSLAGVSTAAWPKPPTPPRKPRQAIKPGDLTRVMAQLPSATLLLAHILRHTGMRVEVEALAGSYRVEDHTGLGYATLYVTGKGGHERAVPVVDTLAVSLLKLRDRWASTKYATHARAWREATRMVGVQTRLPTLHAIRHTYASAIGDITVAQDLLGHASPATTAKYLDVHLGRKLECLR